MSKHHGKVMKALARLRFACISLSLACSVVFLGVNRTAAADVQAITIATVPTEVGAQAYYANDLGYFKELGLNARVISLQNGAAAISAVVSGSIDIVHADSLSLIIAHEKGIPLRVVFGANVNDVRTPTNGILAVKRNSPIRSAKDLAGKTIGVSSLSNTNIYALKTWIDRHGGNSELERYTEVPLPVMADAVASGRIDAASMDAANLNSRTDLRVIAETYPAVAPRFLAGGWFATSSWIKDHPAELRAFLEAMKRASIWANGHHRQAIAIYAKYSRFAVDDLQKAPRPVFFTEGREALPALIQPLVDLAAQYGAIKAKFPASELVFE